MLTIIEIKAREDGGHGLQSQSHRTECWLEGWLAVPPELEQTAWDCAGYCDLDIQDGKLVGAVTHVLVNDPTQGYGILAENMLLEAENGENQS